MCVVLKMIMRTNGKTPKFDDLIHQYLIIVVIVTVVIADNKTLFKCPGPSQWKFRAKSECKDTDKYICLFDGNGQKDEEFCGSWPDFENAGYKQILLGGTTIKPCSEDRYQPFIFWTNGSSKCVLKKENCNQEGQVTHSNGTLQTNRICRCDYTNNYDYVFKPKNGCFCLPSEEDCSCYVKSCQSGNILSRDYECLKESKLKYNCPELYRDSADNEIRRTTIISSVEHVTPADSVEWSAVIVTFVCITAILVLFVGVSLKSRNMQNEVVRHSLHEKKSELQTGMNGSNKNETICRIPKDVLDLQEKEIIKWRERHVLFEETTASKSVLDKMKTQRFVILSGPPGSGKSAIAYHTAFMLETYEEFKILPVSSPEEIQKYLLPETKQVFVIDDPVGKYSVDDLSIQRWKNEEHFIKETFKDSVNTKLILTCRSYIYKSGFSRKLNLAPVHCDLLSYNLNLTFIERKNLCDRYKVPELNEESIMMYNFFPLLCVNFVNNKDTATCFVNPINVLSEEMNSTKERSDIAFLAIALLIVQNNNIKRKTLSLENHTTKELLNDLCNECGFKFFPSTSVLLSALYDLIGTYLKETDDGFACIHDTLFQNISFIVGSGIIHCLLKYGSSSFVANRMQLASIKEEHAELVLIVKPEQEELYFQRLLMDIKKRNHRVVFTGIQMKHSQFRSKLHTCLKSLKSKDITCDQNNYTPLHIVAEQGYDDFVYTLYQIKKDHINHQDENKRTPMFMACLGGHDKIIQTILGLDDSSFYIEDNADLTPLDAASLNNHSSTVNLLLKTGAKVNRKDKHLKRTALQRACESGSTEVVNVLLTKNPDVNNKDTKGLKAIHIACQRGHLDIVELLLRYKTMLNELDDRGRTPLFIACESNQRNIVDMLLQKKANVNQTDNKKMSPLYRACQLGNYKIVEVLLNYSANVNAQSDNGLSPLYAASMKGDLKCVEFLLNKHAEIDLATKQGLTPLFISCKKGHLEICKTLIISGAKINTGDEDATTPLHVACREKHERIVKSLIKHDANVNAVDTKKESPLYIACAKESFAIVQLLINNHADLNICNEKGNSPLHIACFKGNKTIVQLILDQKANIHKRNKAGKTPFDIVQEKKNDSIIDMFNCYKEK